MRLLLVRFVERLFYDLGLKGTNSRIFALEDDLFQPLFVVILLTTVLTPPMVRWVFRTPQPAPQQQISGG